MMNGKMPVSVLQELMAAKKLALPTYLEEEVGGRFKCTVYAGGVVAVGFSNTKKTAKHESAKNALTKLRVLEKPPQLAVQKPPKNYIGDLNEYSSKNGITYPEYNQIKVTLSGQYICKCTFIGRKVLGIGESKKDAKQDAAKNMLKVVHAKTASESEDIEKFIAMFDGLTLHSLLLQNPNDTITKAVPEIKIFEQDSVELLSAKLREHGIDYTISDIQTNPYILSLTVRNSNYTFIENGATREEALRKILQKLLLVRNSGCSLTTDLITF